MSKIGLKISKLNSLNFIRTLISAHTKRAYLVGGCVRDLLLNKKITDFDIEIYDITPDKFDEMMQKAGANGVGKSYFVYKLNGFDLSLPRTENKIGTGHRAFEVGYVTSEREASMRRDFTINAMMINIFSGEFLDFWGGRSDLERGILRHINDDKFCEDSLRVLRGVQFSARLNFKIAPDTLKLMRTLSLDDLSKERISSELMKLFRAKFQSTGAKNLFKLGLFSKLFGINLSKSELEKFMQKLDRTAKFKQDEREFLYLLRSYGLDESAVARLGLPNSFLSAFREPFFEGRVSDKQLLGVALKMPLKEWLGLNSASLIRRAKKLGFYDVKFTSFIDTDEILRSGFKGAAIGAEISRRQNLAVSEFLRDFKVKKYN